MGPWCYVDPITCHNQPFVDSLGGAYDACAATNDTTTYDTGARPLPSSHCPSPAATSPPVGLLGKACNAFAATNIGLTCDMGACPVLTSCN